MIFMKNILLLKLKILDIYADYPIVILHPEVAKKINAVNLDRLELNLNNIVTTGVLDTSESYVNKETVGLFKDTAINYNLKDGDIIEVSLLPLPKAVSYIQDKIKNKTLTKDEIYEIVKNINENKFSAVELSAFVTAIQINGLNIEETEHLCRALVEAGDSIDFKEKIILDKHSIGGINGRVSMILTPIIASLGFKIPKTASRSITSAAGTADAMEVLAPVTFTIDEIKEIIIKVNGVVAWEGKFDLCPVDNKLIDIEHALGINPEGIMIASILSKKKSIGSTHLVIDIPIGNEVKVKNKDDGIRLAKKFIEISKFLKINTKVLLTDGENPTGNNFGPALEAKEVLEILENKYFNNLAEKACLLSGELLELVGYAKKGEGFFVAKESITSGKALEKFREIIKIQGGEIFSSDKIKFAKFKKEFISNSKGIIKDFDVKRLTEIANYSGAPKDIAAGLILHKSIGDKIVPGDLILEIYSESEDKLNQAYDFLMEKAPFDFEQMVIEGIE